MPIATNKLLPKQSEWPTILASPRVFIVRYRLVLVALVIGASLDLFTTLWNMRAYGNSIEVHVPQRMLSDWFGTDIGVPLAKLIQCAFVVAVAAWWTPWCRWLLLSCACLYALAAANNYSLWL